MPTIKIGSEFFDVEQKDQMDYVIEGLENIFIKLGRPEADINSLVFWKFLGQIIQVWAKSFPQELSDWEHDRKIDLAVERSLSDTIKDKAGFKKSVAFPPRLFNLIKLYFPDLRVSDKKFVRKVIKTFPMLHNSNYT